MNKSETEKNFFLEMPSFLEFQELTLDSHYQRVPSDWIVVITDIQGSTKAIEAGKYKTINMAGAATITALTNAIGTRHFPFAFGGDGATAVIPPQEMTRVRAALARSREIAFLDHELKMRPPGPWPHPNGSIEFYSMTRRPSSNLCKMPLMKSPSSSEQ